MSSACYIKQTSNTYHNKLFHVYHCAHVQNLFFGCSRWSRCLTPTTSMHRFWLHHDIILIRCLFCQILPLISELYHLNMPMSLLRFNHRHYPLQMLRQIYFKPHFAPKMWPLGLFWTILLILKYQHFQRLTEWIMEWNISKNAWDATKNL